MVVELSKIQEKAPELISLVKKADETLAQKRLQGQKAKVAAVMDFSGSMRPVYGDGSIQRLAEKLLALATQLDDDGAIDFFVFDSGADYLGEVTLDNFRGVVDRLTRGRHMGTTNYADAFRLVEKHYFGDRKSSGGGFGGLFGRKSLSPLKTPAEDPVFTLFLTDGAPNNAAEAVRAITEVSYSPIFWQFLSIGSENIPFLHKLDELDGRYIDNASYSPVGNVDRINDTKLFEILLEEYPDWVAEERRRGQIR